MTSDTRSPAEIERDIERERAGLTHTLDDLQDRFSVEGITRQVADQFRTHGGEIGHSITEAVKRNPMALALTGAGIAWLMMGDRSGGRRLDYRPEHRDAYGPGYRPGAGRGYGTDYAPGDRATGATDEGRSAFDYPAARPAPRAGIATLSERDLPSWARDEDDDGSGMADRARAARDAVTGAASTAGDKARAAGASVKDAARSTGQGISDAASSVATHASDTASAARDRAARMRERLAEGTEAFSEEARARIVAARERAIEARDAAWRQARHGGERAADLFEEHPLIAGALAVAVGAAIGAALPRSRTEDHYLGEQSDALFHEAERIYAEEKEKLGHVAKAARDEARDIGRETKSQLDAKANADNAAEAVAEKAKKSGERIADAARSEAKKQNLGDVKS